MTRFRVSSLLGVVALSAIILGGFVLFRRSKTFKDLAFRHILTAEILGRRHHMGPVSTRWVDESVAYHRALAVNYGRVAARPWLSVGPDPARPREDDEAERAAAEARLEAIARDAGINP